MIEMDMWRNAVYPTSLIVEIKKLMQQYGQEPVVQASVYISGKTVKKDS